MDFKDGFTACEVGTIHDDLAIESPSSHQRRVQHLRCVGSSHNDDPLRSIEAVHLGQQLIERLFSFVIAENPSAPACTRFSDCIQFIDKDDARSLLLGLFKQISDAGSANADEHLDEFRAGDGEERNASFAADSFCKQSLARTGWPYKKHSFRNSSAKLLVLPRLLEEVDHFHQFGLGFVDPCHVFKADVNFGRPVVDLGAALAERERTWCLTEPAIGVSRDEQKKRDRYDPWE